MGEEDQREGADGGHRHEEALVKAVPVRQLARRFDQHVVAADEEGDQEEHELGVQGVHAERALDQACAFADQDGEEQDDGEDNAVSPAFLLLGHGAVLSGGDVLWWVGAARDARCLV